MAGRPRTRFSLNIGEESVDTSIDILLEDERVFSQVRIFSDKLNSKIASMAYDEEDSQPKIDIQYHGNIGTEGPALLIHDVI